MDDRMFRFLMLSPGGGGGGGDGCSQHFIHGPYSLVLHQLELSIVLCLSIVLRLSIVH